MENNEYTKMQRAQYDKEASNWSLENKDPVIGNYAKHLEYDDRELLFGDRDLSTKKGLDFGCGPGRNLVRFEKVFQQLDGTDISEVCLEKARIHLEAEGFDLASIQLVHCSGVDLATIPTAVYDVVMSVITLQHICVHEIRLNLFKEFYRVLKPQGIFTAQMGYGHRENGHDYYANDYDVQGTNGWNDVMVSDPTQLQTDLESVGFTNFEFTITEVKGGDAHDSWIYFRVTK